MLDGGEWRVERSESRVECMCVCAFLGSARGDVQASGLGAISSLLLLARAFGPEPTREVQSRHCSHRKQRALRRQNRPRQRLEPNCMPRATYMLDVPASYPADTTDATGDPHFARLAQETPQSRRPQTIPTLRQRQQSRKERQGGRQGASTIRRILSCMLLLDRQRPPRYDKLCRVL